VSDTIPLEAIDNLYNGIVSVLTSGVKLFVPIRRRNFYKFWWDQGLDILKDAAINSDKIWKATGKPRQGSLFDKRQRCRAQYREGIRDGQKLDSMSYTNDLHDALLAKDGPSFWKSWRSKFETRSRCTQVEGFVEPEVIADNFARYCKCMPILLYGLECFFLPKSDVKSLDFVVTRFLMKLFWTVNHDIIRDCCMYLKFTLPSDYLVKKYEKFILRYKNCSNLH